MFLRLLCAAALVSAAATSVEKRCTASAPAHLTVSTSHNASGHWLSTLRLEREAPLPGRPGQLLLDVRPSTTRCGNVRTDALVVTLQGSSPPPPPGPGYEELPGIGYYRVHEEKVSWEEAKAACEAEDAHLLILNSEAEATAVRKLIQRYPNVRYWVPVGFNDKEKEGTYVTIFGELLSTTGFYRWGNGNGGDGGTSENCGYIDIPFMNLNDGDCASRYSFVCEQFM